MARRTAGLTLEPVTVQNRRHAASESAVGLSQLARPSAPSPGVKGGTRRALVLCSLSACVVSEGAHSPLGISEALACQGLSAIKDKEPLMFLTDHVPFTCYFRTGSKRAPPNAFLSA